MNHKVLATLVACFALFLSAPAYSAVILQYHHVSTTAPASTSISPTLFEEHLDYIEQKNHEVWPLPKVIEYLKTANDLPKNVVVITFDDAYDSIYETAYPLLKQRKMPFTVFIATEPVQQKLKSFMTWAQLREISAHGATIANHTHTHAHLVRRQSNETEKEWLERVRKEITLAESILEDNLYQAPKLFSYPYGEFTKQIQQVVSELGYSAFGQQSGAAGKGMDLTALPRFPMTNRFGAMGQFKVKVASLPMAAVSVTPPNRIVLTEGDTNSLSSELKITFKTAMPDITCYLLGKAVELEQVGKQVFITSLPTLPVGRSRINCTAPSSEKNRFHWFSHFWMKPHENGTWYDEQ